MKLLRTVMAAAIACSLFVSPTASSKSKSLLDSGAYTPYNLTQQIPKDSRNTLLLCADESGTLYDTILIAAHSVKENKLHLISIPRDLYVPYNDEIQQKIAQAGLSKAKGIFKINASGKIGQLIQYNGMFTGDILQEMVGLPIHEFAIVQVETFKKMVDLMGGISVTVAQDIRTPDGQLCLKQGKQTLNGDQALLYARARKFYDENGKLLPSQGDHTRKAHQLAMIEEVLPQINQKIGLAKLPQIIHLLQTDTEHSFSIGEIYQYYKILQDMGNGTIALESHLLTGTPIDPLHDGCSYLALR